MNSKKIAVLWLCLIMIFCVIVIIIEPLSPCSGATIYVDDDYGSEDATHKITIQAAVNVAQPGDTVFVYNGTYIENVVVNKTINLTGEDRDSTIIMEGWNEDNVRIIADFVNMSGFTLDGITPNNGYAGIELDNVQNCSIFNNIAKENYYGIKLRNSNNNLVVNNFAHSSNMGISLTSSKKNQIIDNNISISSWGIHLSVSTINNITENNLMNVSYGIVLKQSDANNFTANNISNGIDGFNIDASDWNNITHNSINSHSRVGIYLVSNKFVKLKNNTMTDNGICILGHAKDLWNTHDIDISNTVNGKPIYYWKDQIGGAVPQGAGQVILANCTEVLITGMELDNCSAGIELGYSSNNTVTQNNVTSTFRAIYVSNSRWNNITHNGVYLSSASGISLYYSNENIISQNICSFNIGSISTFDSSFNIIIENNVSNNEWGINIPRCSQNLVYHNNIINNTVQATDNRDDNFWDNGYPIGGNYWSEYSGNDDYKGYNQDQPGSDSIGDTPYQIDSDSRDNYPLMEPYTYNLLENYTILKQGWNLISIPLIQKEQNLTRVLGSIDSWYDAVQWYDSPYLNDPWKHHKVGKPFGNDLSELNETMGFWIRITQPGDTIFLYNGTQPTSNQSITLHPGWNMVGYPSMTSYNRTEGLNNLTFDDQVDAIWSYDAATQKWEDMGELDYFEIGRGYYIHAKSECEWEVPL